MTGKFYIAAIIFPEINFGIALHCLFRDYFFGSSNSALHYIILTATLKLHLFWVFTTLHSKFWEQITSAIHYIMFTLKLFQNLKCNHFRSTGIPSHLRLVIMKPAGRIFGISDSNPIKGKCGRSPFRVARLQSEVGTKDFIESRSLSRKTLRN